MPSPIDLSPAKVITSFFRLLIGFCCLGVALTSVSATASAASNPTVTRVNYNGRDAFRLSDGHTEAIVVPSIGRIMSYGFVGGSNFLWNSSTKEYKANEWKNWGGDKTWPAPQSFWVAMSGRGWPPDPAWDGRPHQARILPNGHLQMTSDIAPGIGARVIREFSFAQNGDFLVAQTVEKVRGEPLMLSIWSVTQIVPPDALFMPLNPWSVYKDNFHWIKTPDKESPIASLSTTLLQVRPTPGSSYKIGVDAPVSAMLAVKDGLAFRVRTPLPGGEYPDGALGHGFPAELWNNADPLYNEMELLSPLQLLRTGGRWTHTVRWSLHQLPTKDVNAPELRAEVARLLAEKI